MTTTGSGGLAGAAGAATARGGGAAAAVGAASTPAPAEGGGMPAKFGGGTTVGIGGSVGRSTDAAAGTVTAAGGAGSASFTVSTAQPLSVRARDVAVISVFVPVVRPPGRLPGKGRLIVLLPDVLDQRSFPRFLRSSSPSRSSSRA